MGRLDLVLRTQEVDIGSADIHGDYYDVYVETQNGEVFAVNTAYLQYLEEKYGRFGFLERNIEKIEYWVAPFINPKFNAHFD